MGSPRPAAKGGAVGKTLPAGSDGKPPKGGFKSKAQWRWAWANHMPWARKAAHQTKGGKRVRYERLPTRKGAPTSTTAR